jgi:hypothetical protein
MTRYSRIGCCLLYALLESIGLPWRSRPEYSVGVNTKVQSLNQAEASAVECQERLCQIVSLLMKSPRPAGNDLSDRHNSIDSRYRHFSHGDNPGLQTRPTARASDQSIRHCLGNCSYVCEGIFLITLAQPGTNFIEQRDHHT